MTRLFLSLNAILFLGFGVYTFTNPGAIVDMIAPGGVDADGVYELRSNYGGVSIGAGLLCLAGVIRAAVQRPALFFLFAYTGGYAFGRVIAFALSGGVVPSLPLIGYGVFEIVTATVAFVLLRRLSQSGE